jgi:hypothetical protein
LTGGQNFERRTTGFLQDDRILGRTAADYLPGVQQQNLRDDNRTFDVTVEII